MDKIENFGILEEILEEISEQIVKVVNDTTNDYDAMEQVIEVLDKYLIKEEK